ncbi:alkaline phosphatase D [Tistlia consotensis]|uniref:Alkaline phosphatase D n=1 Tax=Tistlia consotensis USBA 355 TaxID=560819 RepID=A0A1Y6CL12_9PROT|nr:alkaline phosphatase D family protein [Tistlia consotensis]SMF60491.1 alkaline phosphatase D [Tistlia consotensis USBA 355]SNR93360.1 alkaline phosphatase D [Tistlia consotensis]
MTRLLVPNTRFSRRRFLTGSAAGLGVAAVSSFVAPAISRAASRPEITHGIQSGDVMADSGIVWSRSDRPSRMIVEYDTRESFATARRLVGPAALEDSDFTAKVRLSGLPAGQQVFYRVSFEDLSEPGVASAPLQGSFRTAPADRRSVRFVWTGDTVGQGWGINEEWGGLRGFAAMLKQDPDFFLDSGDTIYADGPLEAEKTLPDGTVWKNIVTEEKSKVAETLADFRGNYKYNLLDHNYRALMAAVPRIVQWDDHETLNNWYPGEILPANDRHGVKSSSLLAARTNRAFHEYMPIGTPAQEPDRVYRKIAYGPLLDVFVVDMRSFRGPNGPNRQPAAGPDTAFLGSEQLAWLKRELLASRATWKVIAADMPIGIMVRDGKTDFENSSNGNGPVLGREFEIAELLRFIKLNGVANTVWLTADVHYTAAHYYDPNKAQFQDFEPFWEFVSGPIHAGSFGPGEMDDTFGPQVVFSKDPGGKPNLPPSAGLQFFGLVEIDSESEVMTVTLKDIADTALYSVDLQPKQA